MPAVASGQACESHDCGQHDLDLPGECSDSPEVNLKTAGRIFSGLLICVALMGCGTTSNVISMGNDTYKVTRKADSAFVRDGDKLLAKAKEDAANFCAARGKELKVVDVMVDEPHFSTGYVSARVIFRAVTPGEVNLTSAPAQAEKTPAPAEISAKPSTDNLYADLTKLDELRKQGILSEEEFQAEKKKILSRSQ